MTKVVKMTNREILENATKRLDKAGIAEAGNDAWLLFSEAFGMTRTDYLIDKNAECNAGHIPFFDSCIEKRLAHIPVQYILGKAYFMGYEFEVNNNVLIPRFDTEVLVSEVLKYTQDDFKILDMCTGSGCIGITLAKKFPESRVLGVDVSEIFRYTLQTKNKANFELHKKAYDRMEFLEGGKVAFTYITLEDEIEVGAKPGDHEGIVEVGKNIENVEVSIFLHPVGDKGYKISLRSLEYVNVANIALSLGGGGHNKAAGAFVTGTPEQIKQRALREIRKQLK